MAKDEIWQSEPTVIKPSPGGRRLNKTNDDNYPETTALFTALKATEPADNIDFRSSGMPLVVSAARSQLNLLDRLRSMTGDVDPEQLRMAVIEEMRAYERKVANAGVDVEQARIAHYILCATLDDVVLATKWGAPSQWGANSVVSTFHKDVQGGERFYDLLERQHKDPGNNRDILLLMYFCLSLGFRGRLRVSSRGALELSQIRDGLYRTLKSSMLDNERELSPAWRGINARNARSGFKHLLSAFLAFLVLLVSLGYIGILDLLNTRSDKIIIEIAKLPPSGSPSILLPQAPEPEPIPAAEDPLQKFLVFLKPEIERGVLTTTRNGNEVLVRYRNTGSFKPASADINFEFENLLVRVSKSIADVGFDVLITGHTDNRPIRSIRFPSNWHLSRARAKSVADIASRYISPERILFEGRGETEPVDNNDTPEGRETNRRIEMLVRYTPNTDPNVVIQGVGQPQ